MADLLDRLPAPIRSLWNAEVELRRGLWASLLKRGEPNPHYGEARRHFNEAINSRRPVAEETGKWGSAEHVAATVEQDRIDEATKKPADPANAPRF
jgi:hypothetical protein